MTSGGGIRVKFMNRGRVVRIFFLILVGLHGAPALAQGTAELQGTVKDATGAVLPGATLTITNKASGQVRQLTSDARGNYVVTALPIGEYSIRA